MLKAKFFKSIPALAVGLPVILCGLVWVLMPAKSSHRQHSSPQRSRPSRAARYRRAEEPLAHSDSEPEARWSEKAGSFEKVRDLREMGKDSSWRIKLPDGSDGVAHVNLSVPDSSQPRLWMVSGDLNGKGTFYLAKNDAENKSTGWVIQYDNPTALAASVNASGVWTFAPVPVSSLTCLPVGAKAVSAPTPSMGGSGSDGISMIANAVTTMDIPIYSSRPGSHNTFFLDFRGGSVTIPGWNDGKTVNYDPPSSLDRTKIQKIIARVVEWYAPFDVNITTDPSVYAGASVGHRMRCIIALHEVSGSDDPPAGVGGVGVPGSFRGAGVTFDSNFVCWVACNPLNPNQFDDNAIIALTSDDIAHELGHTLGLYHWGSTAPVANQEYYPDNGSGQYHGGLGDNAWAPLMGFYSNNLGGVIQWSKGEYNNAVRRLSGPTNDVVPDDLTVITTALGAGGPAYLPDDKGDSRATAATLNVTGTAPDDGGVIGSATDEDFFKIVTTTMGDITLDIKHIAENNSLDVYAELQNASGGTIVSNAPDGQRDSHLSASAQPAGTYYLRVRGNNELDPKTNGWSRYGSIGSYKITGTINGAPNPPTIGASDPPPTGAVGVAYSFPLQTTHAPTSYYATSGVLPPGLNFVGDSIAGVPTQAGYYTLNLAVANSLGGTSKTFHFTIRGSVTLPDALDNSGLTWNSTSPPSSPPERLWQGQVLVSQDGTDAARSGAIPDNTDSILTSTVTGPGKLTFYWSTDAAVGDSLIFRIDVTDQFSITGSTPWQQKTVTIPQGTHDITWIYRKDAGGTAGQDAGFIDRVIYLRTPQFPEGNFFADGTLNQPFFKQVLSSQTVNTWTLTGGSLPPGVTLSSTGLLSGTPTATGVYDPQITATNDAGSTTTFPSIYIYPNVTINDAVDAINLTLISGGQNPWFGDTATTHDGVDAAHNGPVNHSQSSWMQSVVTGPGTLSFWWKASTEANLDLVTFSIDGVVQATISGEADWAQKQYTISSGSHTLLWKYSRDGSGNGGQNMAWVDQLVWSPGPTITSPATALGTEGQPFNYSITAINGVTSYNAVNLPVGLTVNTSTGLISGTPANPGAYVVTLVATDATGSGTLTSTFTIQPSINNAVDNTALAFVQGGTLPWFGQQSISYYLGDAAQSGPITDNQQSSISTTINGPGLINFLWRTDSEPTNDYCKFTIDGTEQKRLSGNTAWNVESFSIPTGSHTVAWTYVKNGSTSSGADAAYLDQVAFSASLPNITSPLAVNLTVGTFSEYDITADNNPTGYSVDGAFPPGIWLYSPSIHAILTSGTTKPGVYTLPISVTNAAGTTHATITFNVESAFTGWARNLGLNGINALPTTDTDGDGICNFAEMAFNLNATVRNDGFQVTSKDTATNRLKASFQRSTAYPDVIYEVQVSTDLINWTSIAKSIDGTATQNLGGAFSVSDTQVNIPPYQLYNVVVLDGLVATPGAPRFMRVKVTQQ